MLRVILTITLFIQGQSASDPSGYTMGDSLDSKGQCVMCIYTLQKIAKTTDFARECPDSINLKRPGHGRLWTPNIGQLNNLNVKLQNYLEKSRKSGKNSLPKLIERKPRQPLKIYDPIQQEPIYGGAHANITQDVNKEPFQHPNFHSEILYNLRKDLIHNETEAHLDFLSNLSQHLDENSLLSSKGSRGTN
jgi:hypothetical protein